MLLQYSFATRNEVAGKSKTFGIAVDARLFGGKHRTLGVNCISATTYACLPSSGTLGGREEGGGDTSLLGEIRQLGVIALVAKHSYCTTPTHPAPKDIS